MTRSGIKSVGDIQEMDLNTLEQYFGIYTQRLHECSLLGINHASERTCGLLGEVVRLEAELCVYG